MRKRKNLTIVTEAHATRVLIENGRAVGVEYRTPHGQHTARARGEVIVSGGAYGSPQLLQLSGLGPAELLNELGYRTMVASNASDALKILEEDAGRFDLVFSDIVMPGMDGLQLGQEIRSRFPGLPVVLTSGYSNVLAQNADRGFELIQKPYSVEALSRILRKAISEKRSTLKRPHDS